MKPPFSGCASLRCLLATLAHASCFLGVALVLASAPAARAQTYNFVYNLDAISGPNDLILSGSTFYLTKFRGGTQGNGAVLRIQTNGTGVAFMHSFLGGNLDGGNPGGAVTMVGSTLFGTTYTGGNSFSAGTVYKINTNGTAYSILYSFLPWLGHSPTGALVQSGSALYGIAANDGTGVGYGTVFKISTNGTSYSDLWAFTGATDSGSAPVGSVILADSTLYGMTQFGGSNGVGTVFKVNTNGTGKTILHSFSNGPNDGKLPFGSLILAGATLYGTTERGGFNNGTVFKINTNGTGFAILYQFGLTYGDGYWPRCALTLTGSTLYGTTSKGGTNDNGTIFQINTDGDYYQILYHFRNSDGPPTSSLLLSGSTLFGIGNGLLFALTGIPTPPVSSDSYSAWASCYGLVGGDADGTADPDGDGLSNTNEFLAGFNPINSAAFPHVISIVPSGNDVNVTYLGASGDNTCAGGLAYLTNVLEVTSGVPADGSYSNDFVSTGVSQILSNGTGLGTSSTMVDAGGATNMPSRYYRVRVLAP